MTRVFLSGSRRCSRLTAAVRKRLDNIRREGMCVLVGDAGGVDKAVQAHFADHYYENVIVYCSNGRCRNNLGEWPVHSVDTDAKPGTRTFFAAKDKAMARDANYGFMVWDGQSQGTYDNIVEMLDRGKTALVYTTVDHEFRTVRSFPDLDCIPIIGQRLRRAGANGNKGARTVNGREKPKSAPRLF